MREPNVMELAARYAGPLAASGEFGRMDEIVQESVRLARVVVKGLREEQARVNAMNEKFHKTIAESLAVLALVENESKAKEAFFAHANLDDREGHERLGGEYKAAMTIRAESMKLMREKFAKENNLDESELSFPHVCASCQVRTSGTGEL